MSSIDASRIKLFQLRAFAAVAAAGSFGKAALDLGLTQSAISHAIASLETELGLVLFTRSRHGATLTPAGAALLPHAQAILQHLAQLVHQADTARGLGGGTVRVAAIRSLATHWLPSVVAHFKQRYPQIGVTISRCVNHGEVQTVLHSGQGDVGLMDLNDPQGMQVHPLFSDSYLGLLPPGAPCPCPPTWEDLRPFPLILPVPQDNSYTLLREYLAQLPVQLEVAYELNEDSAIVSMVAEGLGMSILPQLAAIPIPPEVGVVPLPLPLQRHLGAVIVEDHLHSPATYAFLEVAQEFDQVDWASLPIPTGAGRRWFGEGDLL